MNINITNYIESVFNPEGRFNTIKDFYTINGQNGYPVTGSSSCSVDFKIILDGAEYIMKCLRGTNEQMRQKIKEVASYMNLTDTRYLAGYTYLEKEMLVFDNFDNAHYVDVILEHIPEGKRLDQFFEHNIINGGNSVNKFLKGISGLCKWMTVNSVCHGKINPYRIWITHSSTPVLTDLSGMERNVPSEDLKYLATIALVAYISACESGFYSYLGSEMLSEKSNRLPIISELVLEEAPASLKEIATLIMAETSPDIEEMTKVAYSICDTIKKLSQSEPTPIKHLTETINKMGFNHDYSGSLRLAQEQMPKYRFVGESNDCMIRVWDGDKWYYLDKNGEQAIKIPFINASDFKEGRAEVETDSGYGLIDREGKYVIEPIFDDIEWDAVGNLAIVTKDGVSGLYSREGDSITGLTYDQILNISEELITAKKDNRYGYISRDGKTVIDFIYEDAFGFRNGVARVKLKGREYMIDYQGNEVGEISPPKPVTKL